jgi:ABC-type uncharacterized transport system substrate-binding protein
VTSQKEVENAGRRPTGLGRSGRIAALMARRTFLSCMAGALLATPLAAESVPARKARRIGYLSPSTANDLESGWLLEFQLALGRRGYAPGSDVVLVQRYADDRLARLASLATELVDLHVDVIVAFATPASLAAKAVTETIPIVMVAVGDPIAVGLVDSLSRPNGNLTGLALNNVESAGKRLELLKEAVPRLSGAAVLVNPNNASFTALQLARTRSVAAQIGVALFVAELAAPERLAETFALISRQGVQGVNVLPDATFITHRERIAQLALRHRLPTVAPATPFVGGGCLLTYGPDVADIYREAGRFVGKIFSGAKPADLPVEQPTKYELGINLKTAKALGLTIPQSLLMRADEVIE